MKNYYEILQLRYDCKMDDIRKHYRALSMKYHPDLNKNFDTTNQMKKINEAYNVLSNQEKKAAYDKKINLQKLIKEQEKRKSSKGRIVLTKDGYYRE